MIADDRAGLRNNLKPGINALPDDRTAVPPEVMHILIVDDDSRVRRMLARYLEAEGFKMSEAGDGAAMRAALASGDVDLVLLDLVLPGEDGLALAREIR